MPTWTKEQNDAIYLTGQNIIVSAGAGSGKTAVLSERVLKKIESGINIDQLLILTFTKMAANEMKERIRKKIKKNPDLKEQLNRLDNSYITTFDSFSLSIVKKYHYLLNIKKDIEIIPEYLLEMKTKDFLDDILEEKYSENNLSFQKLIDDFCIKDDEGIKKIILSLNQKLNLKYSKKEYLDNYISNFYNDITIKNNINKYLTYIGNKIEDLNNELTIFSNDCDSDYYFKLLDCIKPLLESKDYSEIKKNVDIVLPKLPKSSDELTKSGKKKINDLVSEIKDLVFWDNTDELYQSIILSKDYLEEIIDIINKLDKKVNEYKFIYDLYDFNDISKLAIKIIKENINVKEELQNSFKEIMIDEYQDTSDLQEEFMSLISNNNLYMVGDVKQSIYRFRNANPNIFRNKYNKYRENINGIKIDLLKNFRSREEVLQNVNLIFGYIMDEDIGGANYISEHQMVFGNETYNIEGKTGQNNNFEMYQYDYDHHGNYSKDEIEAFIIANDIKEKIDNHYQIYDKDNNLKRDITYSDFSILIDRATNFELYKKIFLYHKIPLNIYKDEYLNNSDLFLVLKSIYKLIDIIDKNIKEREYYFLSVGRSFLFDYSDNELLQIIKDNNYVNSDIYIKIKNISKNILDESINSLLDKIIIEFQVYERLSKIGSIKEESVKIEYLYNLGSQLNTMGYSYQDFISILDNIIENKYDIKFSLNKDDLDSVKMMTIHKSKGLEFPICYFSGLTTKFNDSDIKEKFIYSNELGIISPYYKEGIGKTFYHELYKNHYYQEEVSEKIRLFYVALTRCKEKMIFVLPKNEIDEEYQKNGLVSNSKRLKYHSFGEMLYSIFSKIDSYSLDIDLEKIHLSKNYNIITKNNIYENLIGNNTKIELINYPNIIPNLKEKSDYSKDNKGLIDNDTKEKMNFGTKMHYYLENIDLVNPNLDLIDKTYRSKIENFIKSDLLKNIKEAKIYHEYEFIYESEFVLKHGIIDLMLEYNDKIDIIDFKLKNIDDEEYEKQLKGYYEYIHQISDKKINIYLYSLIDSIYKKINIL